MTVVRLQRNAPEAENATTCAVCGTTDKRRVTDHIQVGTPGTPQHDEGVCESCGAVIDHVVDRYGGDLTMLVQDSQRVILDRLRLARFKGENTAAEKLLTERMLDAELDEL